MEEFLENKNNFYGRKMRLVLYKVLYRKGLYSLYKVYIKIIKVNSI